MVYTAAKLILSNEQTMFDFNSDCVKSPVAADVTTAGAAIGFCLTAYSVMKIFYSPYMVAKIRKERKHN